ncbi:MAG: RNase adapter RapZ [Thermodesulfobacteriota bacterium]
MSAQDLTIIILTGLSGSGKSTALAALEDAGFFCVDNLPVQLLPKFLELQGQSVSDVTRFAFVMDLRERGFLAQYGEVFEGLSQRGFTLEILFFEASENTLLRRYSETRRQHPLSVGKALLDNIREEKKRLSGLRDIASRVIDTTGLTLHELKALIRDHVEKTSPAARMRVMVMSFGFKHGIPHDADLVMDVRFLPNPYFVSELSARTGTEQPVRDYVLQTDDAKLFLGRFLGLLDYLIPRYEAEGKAYLTIAVGCTGGRHRSVVIAGEVYEHLRSLGVEPSLRHRDLDEQPGQA